MEAPGIEQNEEVTPPSDEGNTNTEDDDILNGDPADEEPVEEEPSEEEVMDSINSVNDVTINADEVVEYDVIIPKGNGYTVTGEAKAKEKTDYTFTVTPADATYEIKTVKYTVGEDTAKTTTPKIAKDGKYTIPAAEVTGKIAIEVTAAKIQYTVTAICSDDVTVQYDEASAVKENKIEAGKDLIFTAKVAEGSNSRITEVSYTMGTGKKTDLKAEDGSYKIEKVTDDITITIKSVKTYTVTFPKPTDDKPSNVTAITDIKINNQPAKPADKFDKDSNGAWEVSVDEGQKISFKVSTEAPFKVNEIYFKSAARVAQKVAVTNGVYSFTVRDNADLAIDTELDPAKCGAFKVTVKGGHEKSATVTVKLPEGEEDKDKITNTTATSGTTIVTRNKKVLLAIAPDEEYDISEVKINGTATEAKKEATGGNPAEWEIELTVNKETAVEVVTAPKEADGARKIKVAFDGDASHLTSVIVKADGQELEKADPYVVPDKSKTVEITITADNGYKPEPDPESPLVNDIAVATVSGKKTYTFTIYAKDIKKVVGDDEDPDTITFKEKPVTYGISFGDTSKVNLNVSIDGQEITSYTGIPEGETVAIRVEQKDASSPLNGVTYTVGTTAKTVKANKGVAAFTVKMTDNVIVTVDTAEPYAAATLKDNSGEDVPAVKGVYNVSHEGTYTVGLLQGKNSISIADIKVLDGKKVLEDEVTISGTSITLSKAVAGRKLTVKLYVEDAYGDYVDTKADYTLQVTKVVSKITAPKTAKQPTDTTRTYKVTTDGELSKLDVKVENTSSAGVIEATFNQETGDVTIKAGQTPGTADVVITDGDKVSSTIKFTSTALISDATAAPTVALKSATDIELSLTVGAKNIDDKLVKGAVYYKVEVTPQGDTKDIPSELLTTVPTKYVQKNGESQPIDVRVAKDDTAFGSGRAWKYDVKVSLIHVKDSSASITDDNIGDNIVKIGDKDDAQSKEFKTAANKPFATLDPAWESNLKLKKGQATLTTGDGSVTIATAQFSKPTTHKTITAKDLANAGGLKVEVEGDVIKATATKGVTTAGKHTIEVVAAAHQTTESVDTMYASKATIVVTVAQGIDSLSVQLPSVSVYKAAGKAATLKATAIFNGDTTGKDKTKQPKAKNLKWEIVDIAGETWPDNKITVKNGTVTIAKDYILKANTADNRFMIKVYADNSKKFVGLAGDEEKGSNPVYSAPITITNKGAQVAAVAIVVEKEGKYEVIAKPTMGANNKIVPTEKEATEINSAQVVAFKEATFDTEFENKDALDAATVPVTNLTFKSSKAKNVEVDNKGILKVNSPTNSVKLTVTANDGSKNKAELTLNVGNDSTEGKTLGLVFCPLEVNEENGKISETEGSQIGAADVKKLDFTGTRLAAKVVAKGNTGGADWEKAPDFANYDVKITGGTKTAQITNKVSFTAKEKVVKVVLTDKSTDTTAEYELTSKDMVDKAVKTKVTASVQGSLHKVGVASEQDVEIKLQFPTQGLGTDEALKAKVDLDWTKMNAKNSSDLYYLRDSLEEVEYTFKNADIKPVKAKGLSTASFKLTFKDDKSFNFNQNSYVLKVTLVNTKAGKDTVLAAAAAATVKVTKTAKFTFKPTTSYTFGAKDGYVVLGGKSSIPEGELNLAFTGLLNIAKKDGKENEFTKNFDIKNGKLVLQSGVKAADIAKDDLTGYLAYTAKTDKSYYDNKDQSGLVKITVKVNNNAVVKYTHGSSASIQNKKDSTATVQIQVTSKDAMDTTWSDSKAVKVVSAQLKKVSDQIKVDVDKDGKLVITMLKDADVTKVKKISADIYIVPEDSGYASTFTAENAKPTELDYKNYAASVKVTLNVTERPKDVQTVDQAKTKISTWMSEVNAATEKPAWLTNDGATKEAIEAAVRAYVDAADSITITVSGDVAVTKATAGQPGSVAGKINVTDGTNSEDIDFSLTISALPEEVTG